MTKAKLNTSVQVIVAMDFDSSQDLSPGKKFPTGTIVYQVLGAGKPPKEVEIRDEENFDDPNILVSHLVSAFSKFPSKKRGVILWDHGGSWDGGYGGDHQNGSVKSPATMTITQIQSALYQAAMELRLTEKPYDFVSFDTCLMGNIETAYEFRNLAKYFFASAEIDFGNGWDYESALNIFSENPGKSIDQLASALVASWDSHHKLAGPSDKYLRTQIAIDTADLESIAAKVKSFIGALSIPLEELAKISGRSSPAYRMSLEEFGSFPVYYKDLGHFLSLLSNSSSSAVNSEAVFLRSSFEGLIKAKSLGDYRIGTQIGLSTELSMGSFWSSGRKAKYMPLAWNRATNWWGLLEIMKIAFDLDATSPSLTTSIINAMNPNVTNKPTISFSTIDSDVDRGMVFLVDKSGADSKFLGFLGHGFVENSNSYSFNWSGKLWKLSSGAVSSLAALDFYSYPGMNAAGGVVGGVYRIRGKLKKGSEVIDAYLVGSVNESTLSDMVFIYNGLSSSRPVSYFAGLGYSFVPIVESLVSNIWIEQTPIPLNSGATGLDLIQQSAPAGPYALGTLLCDVWAKCSIVLNDVTVVTPF